MAERGFQEIANGYCGKTILFAASFEADQVFLRQSNFGRVFNHQHAFVSRNELPEYREQRGFSRSGSAAYEDVLASENIVFEVVSKRAIERPGSNQIFDLEAAGVELPYGQRDAAETAGRNHGRDTASIGQSRIENRFRFGDVISKAPCNVFDCHHEGPLPQGQVRDWSKEALFFNKNEI